MKEALRILRQDISAEDKIWAVTRIGVLDDRTLRLFAVDCATRVLLMPEHDSAPWMLQVVATARASAEGGVTEKKLAVAREAVAGTTKSLAREAARATVQEAACEAAWSAAHVQVRATMQLSASRDAIWEAQVTAFLGLIQRYRTDVAEEES